MAKMPSLVGFIFTSVSYTHLDVYKRQIEDILYEALKHVSRKKKEHHLHVQIDDDLLMADMEAHLIIQVIINLVEDVYKRQVP